MNFHNAPISFPGPRIRDAYDQEGRMCPNICSWLNEGSYYFLKRVLFNIAAKSNIQDIAGPRTPIQTPIQTYPGVLENPFAEWVV